MVSGKGIRIAVDGVRHREQGFTLVELLAALAIGTLLLGGLFGAVAGALQAREALHGRNELSREANFALERMLRALHGTNRLLLPLADNPATDWRENLREQTIPASLPEGSSSKATAVLAVTLDPGIDRDGNGVADADNDGDGRVDEDPDNDTNFDGAHGIIGIDDDGDGVADEGTTDPDGLYSDDDEDGLFGEDGENGLDDDGDGASDEDFSSDINNDGSPGLAGVDDDGDGSIDEGNLNDDDEDGAKGEDWYDPVVFFLAGSSLVERTPVPWDENGDTLKNGRDYIESVIAEQVTRFRVERKVAGRGGLVKLTLELTGSDGEVVAVQSTLRVGN